MITVMTDDQRRAMDFIAAANFGQFRPTEAQVEEWRLRPDPRPGKKGALIEAERQEPVDRPSVRSIYLSPDVMESIARIQRQVADMTISPAVMEAVAALRNIDLTSSFGSTLSAAVSQLSSGPRYRTIPARYEPDGPPETFIEHLCRLGWIDRADNEGLSVSALGRALMTADDAGQGDAAEGAVVLGAHDRMAYPQVISTMVEIETVYVVDPYLRGTDLLLLLDHTPTSRVLIGPNLKASDVAQLKAVLAVHVDRVVELRQAPPQMVHDRYLIGNRGARMVGGSLNNVGRATTTVMVELVDPVAAKVRELADDWWAESTPLVVSPGPTMLSVEPEADVSQRVDAPKKRAARSRPAAKKAASASARKVSATKKASRRAE